MVKAHKVIASVAQIDQAFMDTPANLDKALKAIELAARDGAEIIAFSECYLGQYPYWALSYDASAAHFQKVITALYEGAISIGGPECRAISDAARRHKIHVVMGANELSDEPGSATIYNAMLFFNKQGDLMGRHRKLMPTYTERMVHGFGDGRDIRVYKTDIGTIGGLICWENHMSLAKYALASLGEEIHIANWPGWSRPGNPELGERAVVAEQGEPFTFDGETAIREYAFETGNFVLSASAYMRPQNISDEWREAIGPALYADYANGCSSIVAPGGTYLVRPVVNEEKILTAELDFAQRRIAKAEFDAMGHYSRPDVFSLQLHQTEGRERCYISSDTAASVPSRASTPLWTPADIAQTSDAIR